MELRCARCKLVKDASEFRANRHKANGCQSYCVPCDKERQKEWYKKNVQRTVTRSRNNRLKKVKWYQELKRTLKCARCEESHPACLQFHHRDPSKKDKAVFELVNEGSSWKRIKEEIAKCDVLCANCHFKEHWNEREVRRTERGEASQDSATVPVSSSILPPDSDL